MSTYRLDEVPRLIESPLIETQSVLPAQTSDTAVPPYAPPRRTVRRVLAQYGGLLQVLLTEYRNTWFYHVLFGLLMPLGLIFLFTMLDSDLNRERAIFLIGGNLTMSIAYGPTVMLINKIGWGQTMHEFDYWSALPMPKLVLVLALVSVALIFALPGIIGVYLFGSLLLHLPLSAGLAVFALVPLVALCLTGCGAFIGTYARDGQTANTLGSVLIAFVTFLSPTLIPPEAMPAPLRIIATFIPVTYAADALRAALAGRFDRDLAVDMGVLTLFSVAFLLLVHWKLDWRAA